MSKFINIGLEDENLETTDDQELDNQENLPEPTEKPNETEKAIELVDGENSTDPEVVVKLANYKEELEALKQAKEPEPEEPTDNEEASDTDDSETSETDREPDEGESDKEPDSEEEAEADTAEEDEVEEDTEDNESEEAPEEITDEDQKVMGAANESLSTLLELKAIAEKAKERNSFTPKSIEMLNITTESIKGRLGVSNSKLGTYPAMECFEGSVSRSEHTKEVVVALENTIGAIWGAIKKFLKGIFSWFWSAFTGTKKGSNKAAIMDYKKSNELIHKNKELIKKKQELKEKGSATAKVDDDGKYFNSKLGYLLSATETDILTVEGVTNSLGLYYNFNAEVFIPALSSTVAKIREAIVQVNEATDATFVANILTQIQNGELVETAGFVENDRMAATVGKQDYSFYVSPELPMNTVFFVANGNSGIQTPAQVKGITIDSFDSQSSQPGTRVLLPSTIEENELLLRTGSGGTIADSVKRINDAFDTVATDIKALEKFVNDYIKQMDKAVASSLNPEEARLNSTKSKVMELMGSLLMNVLAGGTLKGQAKWNKYGKLLENYIVQSNKQFI
jgi:hypothetical protein